LYTPVQFEGVEGSTRTFYAIAGVCHAPAQKQNPDYDYSGHESTIIKIAQINFTKIAVPHPKI